jgi:ABC-2 type transport system ATP-binding protein
LAPSDALCKTALLDLFAGKHRPTTGHCLIEGREAHDLPLELKQRVGILENAERPYEVMTIGQTALFFNGCYSEWRDETYDLLINGLGVSRRVKISNLPNHQRALVALAVLLARNPDLLILDDWITTFGDQTRAIFHDAIRRFATQSGKTILLVGHHVGLTPDLIDQLILVGHSTSLALPISHLVSASHLAAEVRTNKTPRPQGPSVPRTSTIVVAPSVRSPARKR